MHPRFTFFFMETQEFKNHQQNDDVKNVVLRDDVVNHIVGLFLINARVLKDIEVPNDFNKFERNGAFVKSPDDGSILYVINLSAPFVDGERYMSITYFMNEAQEISSYNVQFYVKPSND